MPFLRTRTVLAALLAAGTLVLAMPAPAWAHTELLSTSPADAAVLTAPLDEVTLTFSGPVRADGSTVTVTGPDGRSVSEGGVSVVDFVVHQPVAGLTSGAYRVDWVVIAGDGHTMSGQFTFQLSLPAETTEATPTTPAPTAAATPDGATSSPAAAERGGSWLPWLIAALLVVGLAALLFLRRARRS